MRVPDDTENAIRCVDLSVSRSGRGQAIRAVDGVTTTLEAGETLCVAGPTGSGKSSLAAALAGARDRTLSVSGGDAFVTGISVRHPGRAHRVLTYRTGYLPQGGGATLPSRLTVSEVISEPITARDRRVNQRALSVRVAALLDEMHLPLGAAAKFPYELSAGMRQRVAFARALILDPRVLVADEPLANIDLEVRHVIFDAIIRRQQEWGMAAFLVTNDADLARELDADRLILRAGHVVAAGDAEVLRWTPGMKSTETLLVT
ncbi:ATP-binding cassette domain-containing protein [Microbacterium betulae]|uniref:ATP-binding cassette domain-containing protein n=1 Tax=Microbacterium betulae TaxID=2981139 RepID=A0AA97FJS6_9MICO|nr:ATP-binding cassette domain-containing protein [Microbacterium sp. AB]WOF24681.1 ATP-binding cassette domain-containing protein [Microbacterium sp. AB]